MALVAAAPGLRAQEPGGPGRAVPLDEITVTATRTEERAVDALAAVSVTTRQEIRSQQPQRIGTIVSQVPGVSTQENPNDPATAINVRGLQDFGRVAVTVDGARQNFQRSGHNANGAFFLDPAFIRAIDITRGPVANIYGSGAIGGVVSFETVDPRDILRPGERVAGEFSGTGIAGSQLGGYGSAIGAARPTDWFSALAGFSFRNFGQYRDGAGIRILDSDQDLKSGIGKVVVTPADGHTIKVSGQYQSYDFANGIGTSTAPRRQNEVTTSNVVARYSFARPDNPWIDLVATGYVTETDTQQRRISGTPAQIGQSRFFRVTTTGVDVHNTSRFDLGPATLAVTYGGDVFEDRVRTSDPAGNGDETTPSGRRSVYGGFVQGHLKWAAFDVIGAVRYDAYDLSGGRTSSGGDRVSPKITVGFTPLPGLQVYGTYAEGYRAPSVTETLVDGLHPAPASFLFVPNPDLRPEVGRTIEGGVNLRFDDIAAKGDRLRGKAAVFRNDVTDFIDGVFVDPRAPCGAPIPGACADAFFTYQNVARAQLTGVEGEMSYDAGAWFGRLYGSSVRGDNVDAREPLQSVYPDRLGLAGGLRFLDEKLVVGGRVTLVAAQRRLPAVTILTQASKAYALVDLDASYAFSPDTRAYLTLENIGDIRYRRYRDGDFSPGFTAKLGFTTRFGA